MMISSHKDLDNLCFSDFDVFRVEIDKENKLFKLELEGAFLIENNNLKELGCGYVKISNFDEINAVLSNIKLNYERKASIQQIKQLKEINDHEVGKNYVKFSGFINDGSWLECEIKGGCVEASFAAVER
jgi:hypothetical protein